MNVIVGWEEPPRGVGLPGLHQVFLLPCHDVAELLHELGGVGHVIPDGQVGADGEVRHSHMEEGEVEGVHEEGDAGVPGTVQDLHGVRVQGISQHLVQQFRRTDGEGEVEMHVPPPLTGFPELVLIRHSFSESISLARNLPPLNAVDDEAQNPIPVLLPQHDDPRVQARWKALHPFFHPGSGGR